MYILERSLAISNWFLFLILPKILKNDITYNLTNKQSTRKLTTWIVYILLGKNISFYIYIFKKAIYQKLVGLLL